ncbi:MAG: hypothetical protein WDO69_10885 [Pseudomonadota bacterium]
MTEPHPPFPEPLDDDDDDVAWALQTAKVQWTRGGQADAIVWLRRAADSADQLGNVWRSADLRRMTDAIVADIARPSRPPAPLPRFTGSVQLDDLMPARDDGVVTSIPPRSAPARSSPPDSSPPRSIPPRSAPPRSAPPAPVPSYAPRPSYAPLPSYAPVDEAEFEEDIVLEDDVDDDAPNVEIAELRDSEVELSEEIDVIDDEELEDDVIEDDALDVPPASPARQAYDSEELPTQPHIDSTRYSLSLLNVNVPVHAPDPPPAPPPPEQEPHVADVLLGEVRGLEDVPPEGQTVLAREARIERLGADEEISSFGLALCLRGVVKVMPAIADLACARAAKGDIVWSEGNLDDGIALRLVAAEDGTEVAVWDAELLKSIVRDYPWVLEDLKTLADRFQALAGVAMGPLGERLDDSLRATVTERCEIKRLLPGEVLTSKGKAVGGMYIMAAGRLEIMDGDQVESELGPGDFLFAAQVLSNGAAPNDARAGRGGALVLFASRSIAHDLLLSVPPLLEIFAS